MKRIVRGVIAAGLLANAWAAARGADETREELQGTISMSGAWALYPMAIKWAEEFKKIHPKVRIDIAAGGAGKGMADCLARVVDIGMVSRNIYPEEVKRGAWWVSVTKDAVVPTLNEENPVLEAILSRGITRDGFADIWVTGKSKGWGELAGRADAPPINAYTRSDACGAAETWAQYLGARQEDLLGVGVYGDPGLAEAVKKDALGIGFNNINYVYDAKTKRQVQGIRVIPIDLNGNGRTDGDEDFYATRDEVVAAVASGRYPSPPARDLHFVSQGKPEKKVAADFIKWVLTDGQQYVSESGYINLASEKLEEGMKKLEE